MRSRLMDLEWIGYAMEMYFHGGEICIKVEKVDAFCSLKEKLLVTVDLHQVPCDC